MKICLDAGHDGKYNQSNAVPAFYESEFTWAFHLLLKEQLEQYGVQVITTREDQQTPLGLYDRGKLAAGCDLFLSIHANWAQRESADYPLIIVPLNGTGDALGRKLADCIRSTMDTREPAEVWTKASAKGDDWYGVIHGAVSVGVPGIILEHSFYSNRRCAQWLLDGQNLLQLAREEAAVIAEHYGLSKAEPTPGVVLPMLQKGNRGDTVRALQILLTGHGYDLGYYGADGDFGGKTDTALRDYQASVGLVPDGICGDKTWSKLLGLN